MKKFFCALTVGNLACVRKFIKKFERYLNFKSFQNFLMQNSMT